MHAVCNSSDFTEVSSLCMLKINMGIVIIMCQNCIDSIMHSEVYVVSFPEFCVSKLSTILYHLSQCWIMTGDNIIRTYILQYCMYKGNLITNKMTYSTTCWDKVVLHLLSFPLLQLQTQ